MRTPAFQTGRTRVLPIWPRFGAAVIDFMILLIPEIVAYELIAASPVSEVLNFYQAHKSLGLTAAIAHTPQYQASLYHFYIAIEAITAAYLIATYLGLGATVGKLAVGLRITRVNGEPLRVRDAVLRSLPFWVPLLIVPISLPLLFFEYVGGSILIMSRPDHRGPEDLLGNSMVVRKENRGTPLQELMVMRQPTPPPLQPPSTTVGRGGHLPGWEPVSSPPVGVAPGSDDDHPPDPPENPWGDPGEGGP